MKDELISACTSYSACLFVMNSEINWGTVGATVLLLARLIKDVPEAYRVIKKALNKKTKKKKKK